MATASALRPLPAYRLVRGDIVTHDSRRYIVREVRQVVFYLKAGGTESGTKVRLVPMAGGTSRWVSFRNTDIVKTAR